MITSSGESVSSLIVWNRTTAGSSVSGTAGKRMSLTITRSRGTQPSSGAGEMPASFSFSLSRRPMASARLRLGGWSSIQVSAR
jgi:hypothetical protein